MGIFNDFGMQKYVEFFDFEFFAQKKPQYSKY